MFEIESGLIFWTVVSFAILVILLYKVALPPLLSLLREREKYIADSIAAAEENQKKSQEFLAEQKKHLAQVQQQAGKILENARKEGEGLKTEILERAEKNAAYLAERTKQDLAQEKEKILQEVRHETINLVALAASRVLGRVVTVSDHEKLIKESLQHEKN